MINILNKYLVQHQHINIPGLGTLYLERVPASADAENNRIHPPAYTLRFDKYFDAPDKAFFTYLASQEKIPDYEAIKLYNQFAQDLRSKIKLEEQAAWKEMGTFRKDDAGDIVFEPLSRLLHPFEPVAAERIMQESIAADIVPPAVAVVAVQTETPAAIHNVHEVQQPVLPAAARKDRWWLYALVLAAIGIALFLYQLNLYGNIWEAVANHHPLR